MNSTRAAFAVHAGRCLLTIGQPENAAAAFTEALRLLPDFCERRGAEIQLGLARGHGGAAAAIDELARALGAVPT